MKTRLRYFLSILIISILFAAFTVAYAGTTSPFLGHWQGTDVDGSDIRLTISGPPAGPFQLTWTENYISFCDGQAGIVRGTGWLNGDNPELLEVDLWVKCFTTGDSMPFHLTFRYNPGTDTLAVRYYNGMVVLFAHPGRPLPPPPSLNLRVNYGHDWVESFYEAGHAVWVLITDSDGNLRATAEVVTEARDEWDGEAGFQTQPEDWDPAPPDIQPNDWVYGWVDNGASAQVQIGDISGEIALAADSIEGTIYAPWFSNELEVDCHSWGAPLPEEILKYDTVLPDGEDTYFCSWAGEWDIQPDQDVGVGYSGPDGHWVANAFFIPMPSFAAYMPGTIEGYDWPMGLLIKLDINDGNYRAQASSEQRPDFPEGETRVLFELWKDEFVLKTGDHVVMSDIAGNITKELWIADLQVTDINPAERTVSGIHDPQRSFWMGLEDQEPLDIHFDGNTWVATFAVMTPETWGYVAQDDEDHDGTVWDFQVPRYAQAGNFYVEWAQNNPDEVVKLQWQNSANLVNTWAHPACPDDLEFFGNSWVSESEGTPEFFFASLVGWGSTGSWMGPSSTEVNIDSISAGCPGSAEIPVSTYYQFFDDDLRANLMVVQRTFEFGAASYAHDLRPFIPRLFPWDGFTNVLHPNVSSDELIMDATCDFGCVAENWDGSWFAVHNPDTGIGMVVQREPSSYSAALWLDNDGGSFTNSSSFLLLQPDGGFTGLVAETEYLCFYDSSTWTPSLTLPQGCQP